MSNEFIEQAGTRRNEASDLWAITTYFNPVGYQRRRHNFNIFRQSLDIPLLAVELASNGRHELSSKDAEIVIPLQGETFLWQKERLLNVALKNLPPHVRFVAWLDCDVVFLDRSWPDKARNALASVKLLQPFASAYHLDRGETPETFHRRPREATGRSLASIYKSDSWQPNDFHPDTTLQFRRCCCGLAWVAHRELLDRHKFYDAMICGSGDRALAFAALGRCDDAIYAARLGERRAQHYRQWAQPFFDSIQSSMDCLDGGLLHLWHGAIENRNYVERHMALAELDFDPDNDLSVGSAGEWTLREGRSDVQTFLKNYFRNRREDG